MTSLVLRRKRRRDDEPITTLHVKVARTVDNNNKEERESDGHKESRSHVDVKFELLETVPKSNVGKVEKRKVDSHVSNHDDESDDHGESTAPTPALTTKKRRLFRTSVVSGLKLACVVDNEGEGEQRNVLEVVDENEISLNGVKAVRESVDVQDSQEEEFVYDVYELNNSNELDVVDFDDAFLDRVMSVHGICVDDLVHDQDDDEYTKFEKQMLGEDSDSNDEDNWRNDYPDEEDYNYNAFDSQDEENVDQDDYWQRMYSLRLSERSNESDDNNEF